MLIAHRQSNTSLSAMSTSLAYYAKIHSCHGIQMLISCKIYTIAKEVDGCLCRLVFCCFFNKMCSGSLSKFTPFLILIKSFLNSNTKGTFLILTIRKLPMASMQQLLLPDEFSTFLSHPISGVVLEIWNNRCVSPSLYHLCDSSSS